VVFAEKDITSMIRPLGLLAQGGGVRVSQVLRISRVVADLDRAEAFYRDALGFRTADRGPVAFAAAGSQAVMRLGQEEIALVQFDAPGRPYPPASRSDDLWFQHLAIVVRDMDAAYGHLAARSGWRPITEGEPQTLPPENGGVRAFKFRDPDGHPLELIWFPPGQGRACWRESSAPGPFLGIDHSALSVSSTARSLAFYRRLGLRIVSRSRNRGPAQSLLDGLPGARVSVAGLRPPSADGLGADGLGLELLAYRPPGRAVGSSAIADVATDWVTLAVDRLPGGLPRMLRDPDRHLLMLIDQRSASGLPAVGPAA
jgi:catechol 2,3-dioxygenase-like lactoylglutathione lyase family enzyme